MGIVGIGAWRGAVMLSRATPGWWSAIDPTNKQVAAAALRVENGAATQLTRIRQTDPGTAGSVPWTIKLTSADANAWLAARLRPWLESQADGAFIWPKELEGVEVRFDGGRILVGARVHDKQAGGGPGPSRVVTASLRPEFREDGALWLPATGMTIGRLYVPPSWMLARAKPRARSGVGRVSAGFAGTDAEREESLANLPELRDVVEAIGGKVPVMRLPIIKIGDGRRVRIVKLEPEDDALYMTFQTLPREAARAEK